MVNISLDFSGGAELLVDGKKKNQVNLPDGQTWTIKELLIWIKDNLLKKRPELFLQDDSVRPGILVLINDSDWDLMGNLTYEIQENDNITFISTLHGETSMSGRGVTKISNRNSQPGQAPIPYNVPATQQQQPAINQAASTSHSLRSGSNTANSTQATNEVPPSSSVQTNSQNENLAAVTTPSNSIIVNVEGTATSSSSLINFDSNESTSSQNAAAPVDTSLNDTLLDMNPHHKKSMNNIFLQRIKKRPINNVSNDSDSELTCPICFDLIDVAHVTKCGHSFCQSCIQTALEHTHRCPQCNTPCSIQKDVFPNFTLNQIIERYKEETNNKKCKFSQSVSPNLVDAINTARDDLNIDDVNQLLLILSQRKEELRYQNKKVTELLLHDFLKHLQQVKSEELVKIQHELQMVNEDCKNVEEFLKTVNKDQLTIESPGSPSSKQIKTEPPAQASSTAAVLNTEPETTQANKKSANRAPSSSDKLKSVLASKKRIIHRYFDELSQAYVQSHNRDFSDFNRRDKTKNTAQSIVLDEIRQTVSKITNCSEFRCIASVNYNSDLYSLSSIVSSVDFDRSYEHFAMAGVTKRIKIFDFNNILERPEVVHYPLYEMTHNAKLSCVSWNRYFRQQLACSDYEGVVTLWDAEAGTLMRSYQEHEKRCWSTQFCNVDPRLLCSASDDSKVKIWSTNSEYSLLSIDAKSNVCCCVFKPDSKFHVLFGTADHSIHYYDLRNPKEAVSLYKGHKKAVSYVKFSGDNQFVSASTDSTLKMWNLNEGQCTRSFTGHVNEKNFVGLETHNGYVITGSENNTCYLYCNELSKPLLSYKFDDGGMAKKDEAMNDFVSAVCWDNSNHLLAANSQGVVKVLELV